MPTKAPRDLLAATVNLRSVLSTQAGLRVTPSSDRQSVHAAMCGIWDIPDNSAVERLLADGVGDEASAAYLSQITPIYSALARVLAQFGGLLLMAMTGLSRGIALDHQIQSSALEQLAEISARLPALTPPPAARRHHVVMTDILARLSAVPQRNGSDFVDAW